MRNHISLSNKGVSFSVYLAMMFGNCWSSYGYYLIYILSSSIWPLCYGWSACLIVCMYVVGLVGLVFWVDWSLIWWVWWLAPVEFPRRNGSSMSIQAANIRARSCICLFRGQSMGRAGDICQFDMLFSSFLRAEFVWYCRLFFWMTRTEGGQIQLSLVDQSNQRFSIIEIDGMWGLLIIISVCFPLFYVLKCG
jgi:hypothetical protein